uniref:Uncharacterized protein n=1 Tax=Oryza meridionalis TaxID=40149 RepID=A0A0E0D259_9ORYZ
MEEAGAVAEGNSTIYCASATNSSAGGYCAVAPFVSFSQVSGGGEALSAGCRSGDARSSAGPPRCLGQLRRVYNGPDQLVELVVGDGHVAAYDAEARAIR